MGEVYVAFDGRLGREVALKVLRASNAAAPAWVARFEREARALGMLNHPSIVVVHDFGTHGGMPYLVTELLLGETLRARLKAGPVSQLTALEWARHIAAGLAAAHARGIIHRDLKPANLFITSDGGVKILDFGIAKLANAVPQGHKAILGAGDTRTDRLTATGEILGTVGYMSPEQVRGEPTDVRSDVFSFGAVLYEVVTGRQAFAGESLPEIAVAVMKDEPPPMTTAADRISSELEQITRRCLEKRPENRFQTAEELKNALDALARPQLAARHALLIRWTPRAWLLLVIVTILAVAVAALGR
jgi:serine/threonine protein kinase